MAAAGELNVGWSWPVAVGCWGPKMEARHTLFNDLESSGQPQPCMAPRRLVAFACSPIIGDVASSRP